MIRSKHSSGFTLIELSIALIIIGLLAGGILVGQTLINASSIRATLSQIESYKTAIHTFRIKYNALPGDILASQASQIGLLPRSGGIGDGDGNGKIEGLGGGSAILLGGETVLFWTDLSGTQLIGNALNDASDALVDGVVDSAYVPPARIGRGSMIFFFSGALTQLYSNSNIQCMCFEIARPVSAAAGQVSVADAITPAEASAIDSKIDDGLPRSGHVVAAMPGLSGSADLLNVPAYHHTLTDEQKCLWGDTLTSVTAPYTYNMHNADAISCNLEINSGI